MPKAPYDVLVLGKVVPNYRPAHSRALSVGPQHSSEVSVHSMSALFELRDKGAIITGGGSGINLSFAKAIYSQGCSVLIGDLALHKDAKDWLRSISDNGSTAQVYFKKTDVTAWDQLERLFDVFAAKFKGHGVPDIVVAGAGIYEASSPGFWNERDGASRYKILDVNVLHPIKLTRIAIRRLQRAKKFGIVLHESSIVALKASAVLPLYAVSKAALSHFVRCMAPLSEMANVKVVAVAPGIVDTPLFRDHPEALDHIDAKQDFLLPAEEVVKAMIALVIDSKYQAGTILEVNDIGGWREVQLLNDPGPQGHSKNARSKALEAISYVKEILAEDAKGDRASVALKL